MLTNICPSAEIPARLSSAVPVIETRFFTLDRSDGSVTLETGGVTS